MIGMEVGDDDPPDPAAAEMRREDALPRLLGFGHRKAGIDAVQPARPRRSHRLMWLSAKGSFIRSHNTPGRDRHDLARAGAVVTGKCRVSSVHYPFFSRWRIDRQARTLQQFATSGKPAGQQCAGGGAARDEKANDARFQRTGALGGDGGKRHGRDVASAGDARRPRRAQGGRQRRRCRDRGGRDAMRRRARKHRDRRRLLYPLFAEGRVPVALNGSGRAPATANVEWFVERRIREIGDETPHAVTIPGCIDAWCSFNREYGTQAAFRAAGAGGERRPRTAMS